MDSEVIKILIQEWGLAGSGWVLSAWLIYLRQQDMQQLLKSYDKSTEAITRLTVLIEERLPRSRQ